MAADPSTNKPSAPTTQQQHPQGSGNSATNRPGQEAPSDKQQVQGEGDYKSNERYTESVQDFVESGKVADAASKAKPDTQQQAEELRRAEHQGASHAKGEKSHEKGEQQRP